MSTISKARRRPTIATLAMFYDNQSAAEGDDLVIPEDLASLSDDDLADLTTRANEAFDTLYGEDGSGLSDDEFTALAALREGIIALAGEATSRQTAATERQAQAAAFAAEVRGDAASEGDDEGEPGDGEEGNESAAEGGDADADAAAEVVAEAEAAVEDAASVVASAAARRTAPTRIPMSSISRRTPAPRQRGAGDTPTIRDVLVASGEGLDVAVGSGLTMDEAGTALARRLKDFNQKHYESMAARGQRVSNQRPLIQLRREIPAELTVSDRGDDLMEVMDRAADESRLPGNSLVAAGGWCAPSQVLYDLVGEGSSRDGLLSLPEIGVPRGGISFTLGVDFADLFQQIQDREIGFSFTEEDDIAGAYQWDAEDGENVVGPKPCYRIECPPFEEYRLDVDGLCIQSGLLQQRAYPEVLADTLRKVLIAHEHYLNGKQIAQMVAGSDAVTLPATQVGTTAPVLTAIELQVESYRYARRLSRSATLEAVFPFWVRGAIRSDLSRRLGVDLIDVNDARIDAWFRARGISPQFVYNWQAISGVAASVTAWPSTVSFLLYRAGTWIRGAADIITVDTLYDSVLLGNNDFTALFTEEGWFVAKRGQDSRLVTTSITADGAAHIGVDIAHNGTLVPAPVVPGATEGAPLFTSEVA